MNKPQTLGGTAALVLTVLIGGLTAGCGSGDSSSAGSSASSDSAASSSSPAPSPSASKSTGSGKKSSSAPAAAPAAVITIKDYAYDVPSGIKAGDEVMITNEDDVAHTVTARDGKSFDVKIDPGKTATLTAPASGSYDFYCIYHSNMEATLEVA